MEELTDLLAEFNEYEFDFDTTLEEVYQASKVNVENNLARNCSPSHAG